MQGMIQEGLTPAQAAAQFWLVDHEGLITDKREQLQYGQAPYAHAATVVALSPLCRFH